MKVLVAHGDLAAGGGAEAYARAILAALRTAGHQAHGLDIHGLAAADAQPAPWLFLPGRLPGLRTLHLLKYALVCRALPRLAQGYDRVILTYGEGPPLPVPALTLRHAPALFSTARADLDALGAAGRGRVHRALRRIYTRAMRRLAGIDRGAATGPVIANSRWTAERVRRAVPEAAVQVLYPDVRPPRVRPARRERYRVLVLGRMTRNKRIGDAIAIAARLRAQGFPIRLDIVGRAGTRHAARLMARHRHRGWIAFHPDAPPERLQALLARASFGLHCYRQEHFGIAVAEMICAGVLPLVHDGGGVCELVPPRRLRFRGIGEAADRLGALMMAAPAETDRLLRDLRSGAALAGALHFEDGLRPILAGFLGEAA